MPKIAYQKLETSKRKTTQQSIYFDLFCCTFPAGKLACINCTDRICESIQMPSTYLWAVSNQGRVFKLAANSTFWEEVKNRDSHITPGTLSQFRKVSAAVGVTWAVGCDRHLYIYVVSTDVPIRVLEWTYENERWTPFGGFSNKLLPTDPKHWSQDDGSVETPKESFQLPSAAWCWEEDWYFDENFYGHITDKGGWQYAVNFPNQWTAEQKWTSCVRRRKWIRHRKYTATDIWNKIPGVPGESSGTPFADVAIGGQDMPNQSLGQLCVWAITDSGKVYFRTNVTRDCPEGQNWQEISIGEDLEVIAVSVGPMGHVWITTWDGNALVRMGVTWDNVIGTHWVKVEAPSNEITFLQVSVGVNAVWAISRDGKIWFRRGVVGSSSDQESVTGSGWIEMVGEMSMLSVGLNDQVWGIGLNDRLIYYRLGVTPSNLGGKTWKAISLKAGKTIDSCSSYSSVASFDATYTCSASYTTDPLNPGKDSFITDDRSIHKKNDEIRGKQHSDLIDNGKEKESSQNDWNAEPDCDSKNTNNMNTGNVLKEALETVPKFKDFEINDQQVPKESKTETVDVGSKRDTVDVGKTLRCNTEDNTNYNSENDGTFKFSIFERQNSYDLSASDSIIDFVSDMELESDQDTEKSLRATSNEEKKSQREIIGDGDGQKNLDLSSKKNIELDTIDHRTADSSSNLPTVQNIKSSPEHHYDIDSLSCDFMVLTQSDFTGEPLFTAVSGMACNIDVMSTPLWFSSEFDFDKPKKSSITTFGSDKWRKILLNQLHARNLRELSKFQHYEQAIERTTWVKKGKMQWWREHKPCKWIECGLELEQGSIEKEGTLTIHYEHKKVQKHIQLQLSEIVCVVEVKDPSNKSVFGIFTTPRLRKNMALKLSTPTEEEEEDWVSSISQACCKLRGIKGPVHERAAWSTTALGDVFVHSPIPNLGDIPANEIFWYQLGGHLEKVESNRSGIVWGLGYDHTAWVYNGGYGGGLFKGLNSDLDKINSMTDIRSIYVYENQRWNPVTGFSYKALPIGRPTWSDISGREECTKENTKLPSVHWQWISDWMIDYTPQGGTDKEGWQYAHDYHMYYHGEKRWRDSVRRRRWGRKCKILSSGPWEEVEPLPLQDISIQIDYEEDSGLAAAVWAVGSNGDVMCRLGVTKQCPQGTHWQHVPTDQPFQSISVGGWYRVWAIAKDSSIWFRNGVSPQCPLGTRWFHVTPPPHGFRMHQVAAGKTAVWAVDDKYGLWYRKEITPTYPEGLCWIRVCGKVKQVSVGPQDQVWIVADVIDTPSGPVYGVVAKRKGITADLPGGSTWELGIGGGWSTVCIRGCAEEEREVSTEIGTDIASFPEMMTRTDQQGHTVAT
ncbi:tectonin beta-propeller repeat-containing protein 1 [Lingula anatina]|uniref:Tectonin beta-propeller repeat-containing protein 1 n=1 Tax=Lingula anatina TaxID=7574 RepID=A0A1S3HEN5_LINAN|nr:tectonin beta-propeller repeat-containing protein 1 [Lingula anatina]|eukprot:XP_013383971.1 tectonin beta-propeller repeat-containing protein 1 [Lingula anatina]